MKIKHIILFLLLTLVLMSLSYLLLGAIERHMNFLVIMIVAGLIVADLTLMVRLFLRFMMSSPDNS